MDLKFIFIAKTFEKIVLKGINIMFLTLILNFIKYKLVNME